MPIVKKYKVANEHLHSINDVDCTYFDSTKPAVKIIQPISVSYNQFINVDEADVEMWTKSLKRGIVFSFIKQGVIKVVYWNEEEQKEVSEEEYKNFIGTETVQTNEVNQLAKLLSAKGITPEKLAALLDRDAEKTTAPEKPEPSPIRLIKETEDGTVYEQHARQTYQKQLKSIPTITDVQLLKEIVKKDKRALIIKTVNARLKNLGAL